MVWVHSGHGHRLPRILEATDVCDQNGPTKQTSWTSKMSQDVAQEASGLEDVLPSNSIHEVKVATSWLLTIAVKAREPAIIIGELKFTWGHLVIVSLGGTCDVEIATSTDRSWWSLDASTLNLAGFHWFLHGFPLRMRLFASVCCLKQCPCSDPWG